MNNTAKTQMKDGHTVKPDDISSPEFICTVNENLTLIQRRDGLTFGTDAYLLAAYVRPSKYAIAAELGGGTGIVSLLCAVRSKIQRVFSVEVQKEYALLIEKNARYNRLSDKVISRHADIRDITPADFERELDIVITNPPYMRTDSGKPNESTEKNIARHEVFGSIYDFCASSARLLKYGGLFYCVYRPDRLVDLIDACRKSRLEPKRATFVYPDTTSPPSLVLLEAKKEGAPSLIITPPLIIYKEGTREYTEQMQRVYDTGIL
ncbi:MAG: methyltransferase [Clostridiales bacterium]|nr:methyltransferase [Clostridiales bacterium]